MYHSSLDNREPPDSILFVPITTANSPNILMRLPSFPQLVRTLYAFSNTTFRAAPAPLRPALRPTAVRSMPTIPFLGALFSSSSSNNMTYPLEKSKEEWQAQLSPGKHSRQSSTLQITANFLIQSNSVSSEERAPKPHSPESTTSTCPPRECTHVPDATHLCTRRSTSSSLVAAGRRSLTLSLEPSPDTPTAHLAWRGSRLCVRTVEVISVMFSRERATLHPRTRGIASTVSA